VVYKGVKIYEHPYGGDVSISTRLTAALKQSGKGKLQFQRELAATEVDGSSYPSIARYLSGEAEPSVAFLRTAADTLGVRFAWLVAGEGAMTEDQLRPGQELPQRELDEWWMVIDRELKAEGELRDALYSWPGVAFNAATFFHHAAQAANVRAPYPDASSEAGQKVRSEYREAIRHELLAKMTLVRSWIDRVGADKVRKILSQPRAIAEVRAGFPTIPSTFSPFGSVLPPGTKPRPWSEWKASVGKKRK
jgi:transcriptional regulator with XRE-family HTH domain